MYEYEDKLGCSQAAGASDVLVVQAAGSVAGAVASAVEVLEGSVSAALDVCVGLVVVDGDAEAVTAGAALTRPREGCLSDWRGQVGLWCYQLGCGQTNAESA